MSKNKKPKENINHWMMTANAILTLIAIVWLLLITRLIFYPLLTCWLITLSAFLLTSQIVALIHEFGHLAGGLSVGFRFAYFVAGPLKIIRQQRQLKLSFGRTYGFKGGGLVGLFPTGTNNLSSHMLFFITCGLLANVVTGVVAAGLFTMSGTAEAWVRFVIGFFATYSLLTFFLNALPFESSGFTSDGRTILTLLKGGPQAERIVAHLAIDAASQAGVRPCDWDCLLVQQVLALQDNSGKEVISHLLAYFSALDCGDIKSAGEHLDRAMTLREKYPLANRARLFLEATYFEACYRDNAETAREWFNQVEGGILVEPHTRLRAEAAVLLAEGDCESALKRAEEAIPFLDKSIDPGEAVMERKLLQGIMELAQTRQDISDRQHPAVAM